MGPLNHNLTAIGGGGCGRNRYDWMEYLRRSPQGSVVHFGWRPPVDRPSTDRTSYRKPEAAELGQSDPSSSRLDGAATISHQGGWWGETSPPACSRPPALTLDPLPLRIGHDLPGYQGRARSVRTRLFRTKPDRRERRFDRVGRADVRHESLPPGADTT